MHLIFKLYFVLSRHYNILSINKINYNWITVDNTSNIDLMIHFLGQSWTFGYFAILK